MKYLAFDIEIARIIPEGEKDWKAHRPLGITCAAAASSDGGLWNWWAQDDLGKFTDKMSETQCWSLVQTLNRLVRQGYTLLSWNGLGFDFDVLREESADDMNFCRDLALGHIDMMFHFFCGKGFPLGLDVASKGMDLPGKPEGMDGAKAPELWPTDPHKVMAYCSLDVKNTLGLAEAVDEAYCLEWTAKSGWRNTWYSKKWLTVKEALALPEPDTDWMKDPWPRSKFYGWTGYKPAPRIVGKEMEEEERKEIKEVLEQPQLPPFDVTGIVQWDPDEGSQCIDGPDET